MEQFGLNSTSTSGVVTYPILVAVDLCDERLKPGMTAQMRIVSGSKIDALRIPAAAMRFRPDEDEPKTPPCAKDSAASSASASAAASAPSAARASLASTRWEPASARCC